MHREDANQGKEANPEFLRVPGHLKLQNCKLRERKRRRKAQVNQRVIDFQIVRVTPCPLKNEVSNDFACFCILIREKEGKQNQEVIPKKIYEG